MLLNPAMPSEGCPECNEYLDRTCHALERHIRAVGRLQDAVVRGDLEALAALETQVKDARVDRMTVTEEYRQHLATHLEPSKAQSA